MDCGGLLMLWPGGRVAGWQIMREVKWFTPMKKRPVTLRRNLGLLLLSQSRSGQWC